MPSFGEEPPPLPDFAFPLALLPPPPSSPQLLCEPNKLAKTNRFCASACDCDSHGRGRQLPGSRTAGNVGGRYQLSSPLEAPSSPPSESPSHSPQSGLRAATWNQPRPLDALQQGPTLSLASSSFFLEVVPFWADTAPSPELTARVFLNPTMHPRLHT
ncbi:MAG: hypothetical protein BJ554DRAFT_5329 [Olpidium bornovanus]|uniref:Uncharacterized protein n=1 Tax=Olpidium bornovanus TaxID=278681 RepID=A0A8H8DMU8_9FUNG|nr:MAG: hypothetical protein BJ554DRAFT_5329 [Olpidium bornovanus]